MQDVGGNWQRLLSGVTHDAAKATEKKNDQEMLLGYHLIAEMTVKRVDRRKVIDDSGVLAYACHWERQMLLVESAYATAETNRERKSSSTRYSVDAKRD